MTEKVFLKKISLSIAVIVVCLLLFSLSAWAMFGETVSTGNQQLTAGYFDVSVTDVTDPLNPKSITLNNHSFQENGGTYSILLAPTGTAESGYCIVQITDTYNGTVTSCVEASSTNPITFEIIDELQVTITITPVWGEPSETPINYISYMGLL